MWQLREADAFAHQPIQVRRVHVGKAERGDRVVALLVGDDEDDVRAAVSHGLAPMGQGWAWRRQAAGAGSLVQELAAQQRKEAHIVEVAFEEVVFAQRAFFAEAQCT